MQKLSDIFENRKPIKKPPAHQWQDLALRIIDELRIPISKRNSIFKICKNNDKNFVEKCFDDTKELAQGRQKWLYFFKLAADKKKPDEKEKKEN